MSPHWLIILLVGVICQWPRPAAGHGRLLEPPGRSSMWRKGFSTPPNYNDHELNCGGFQHQLSLGYKCGTCGDPYDGVRENEAGGKYATGIITRTYRRGQVVNVQVELTASHKGYFEFHVCPTNNVKVKASEGCFSAYPLALTHGSGTRFDVGTSSGMKNVQVRLPPNLTCSSCVLRWKYHTGNSWGTNPDGRSCVGCGPQEEFYGCSDIRIVA